MPSNYSSSSFFLFTFSLQVPGPLPSHVVSTFAFILSSVYFISPFYSYPDNALVRALSGHVNQSGVESADGKVLPEGKPLDSFTKIYGVAPTAQLGGWVGSLKKKEKNSDVTADTSVKGACRS